MTAAIYRDALYEALRGGTKPETALARLKDILKKNGHTSLYARILKETESLLSKEEARHTMTVTVAKEQATSAFKKEIERIKETFNATTIVFKEDPTIIGGYIAATGEKHLDASYKKSLLSLYRALTA